MTDLQNAVHNLVRDGLQHVFGRPALVGRADAAWQKLRATGTRLWLDTGDMEEAAKLWVAEFEALTTNNTLLNKEVQKGIYDGLVKRAAQAIRQAAPGISEHDLVLEIAFVLNAHHGLRLVEKFDAFVSVELHTDLAHDVERTVAYGQRYFAICPERFIVKVPFTPAGLLGARQLRRAGVPINLTLGFSARQNYLAALLTKPNYVNVFMGRLNSYVADNQLGSGDNVGERATLATQHALRALRQAGQTDTQLIGASVRSGAQVAACASVDVLTIPTKAAAEFHAKPPATVEPQAIPATDFRDDTLWEVPSSFREAVTSLLAGDVDRLSPGKLQEHFARAGLPGFLPSWSVAEIAAIREDGKIPKAMRWQSALANGTVGLDALMNQSALQSFVTDQEALDTRVRGLLG
jgi:transaldolase